MAVAAPNKPTELSGPLENMDRPPRLATCLQRAIEPRRVAEAGDGTAELSIYESLDATHVEEVLQWIATMLEDDAGFESVWEHPAGQHPNPSEVVEEEEAWAKLMDQLFLGCAYGGFDIVAQFPSNGLIRGAGYVYLLQRFMPRDGDEITMDDPACPLVVSCQGMTTLAALGRGLTLDGDLGNVGIPASQGASGLPIFEPRQANLWASQGGSGRCPSA